MRLDRLGPALPVNGGYAHAGRFIAALPGITASSAHIEQRLAETLPVIVVLISELASIAFGLMAFRTNSRTDIRTVRAITERAEPFTTEEIDDLKRLVRPPVQSGEPDKKPDNPGPSGWVFTGASKNSDRPPSRMTREQAEADLVTLLALGQSVPSQESLSVRWNRPKQTVSDWLRSWESDERRLSRCHPSSGFRNRRRP